MIVFIDLIVWIVNISDAWLTLPSWCGAGYMKALETVEVSSAALEDVSLTEDNTRTQTNADAGNEELTEPRAVSELQGKQISSRLQVGVVCYIVRA